MDFGKEKRRADRPKMLYERQSPVGNSALFVLLVLLLALLIFSFWFSRRYMVVQVMGSSMEHTLSDGDVLYADIAASPARGDVVIIDVRNHRAEFGEEADFIIKRLIALEGDSVLCENHIVYVKRAGTQEYLPLDEPYTGEYVTGDFGEVQVGAGEIFFMGDHRTNSADSRSVGCLKQTDITGVVPAWAVKLKWLTGAWENVRSLFSFGK